MKQRTFSAAFTSIIPIALLFLLNLYRGQAATDPWEALPKYQFGQSREPLASIEEQIRKGGVAERQNMERRLLEILQAPETTKDSRRFICRWLGTVGSEKSVAPLAALLADPDLAHPARIGLEMLPHPSADKALIDALPKVKGPLQIGVISSLGARRAATSVSALSGLLKDSDASVVVAALSALGQVGTEPAGKALASVKVPPALERDLARARIGAATRLAESGKKPAAAAVFTELMNKPGQNPAIRIAAFQGLAGALPQDEAVTLIMKALEGDDALLRPAAVKAFASVGAARDSVAARLTSMQPKGQLLLLGILADAPEVAARKPLLQIAESSSDPAVKAAAVECLATHGKAEDVPLVAKWAATAEDPLKAAARRTLQRISGAGVDEALIRLIESADSSQRKAVMEALPGRRMQSALPTLTRLAAGGDAALAAEAARTVGRMGGPAQVKDLTQVLTSTSNESVRAAAQEAIKSICTRAEDKAACAQIIQGELEKAAAAEPRKALLPLTVYSGGQPGLALVLKAMADQDAGVRAVAFRTLVEWPEANAAEPLLQFARTNREPSQVILALRDGCLRLAEMEEVPASDRARILRNVSQVAQRPEEKKRAISLMGQVSSQELLEFVSSLAADNGLRAEATASTIQLARNLAAVYPRQCVAALERVGKLADTPELRKAVEDGIKAVRNAGQSPEGFIIGWMLSGPYKEADKDGSALFDLAFAPEKPDGKAEWRPLSAPQNGIVDLGKLMPGENRVAYLRAAVSSEQDQKALLELGSDDGIKVWLNGQLVHGNNSVRPCTPGQDKVNVNLKKGDNLLLLKVTQGGGDWAAVARLRGADGKPLSSIMVGAAPE